MAITLDIVRHPSKARPLCPLGPLGAAVELLQKHNQLCLLCHPLQIAAQCSQFGLVPLEILEQVSKYPSFHVRNGCSVNESSSEMGDLQNGDF